MGPKRTVVKKEPPARKPPASPKKVGKDVPVSPSKNKGLKLECFSFDAMPEIEVYMFSKNDTDDAYLGGAREYLSGNTERHEDIDQLNLHSIVERRVPGSANVAMAQGDKPMYARSLIIRYPTTKLSTIETRQHGLQTLKRFFGNEGFNYHKYPITNITLADKTDEYKFTKLDDWFKDETIEILLMNDIDEKYRNEDFCDVFPDYAKKLLRGPYFGPFALSLGFGSLDYNDSDDENE